MTEKKVTKGENNPTKIKTQKHEDNKRSNKEAEIGIIEKHVY